MRIRQRVSRRVSLNKHDKQQIKKHVENVKGLCEIQKVKKNQTK